MGVSCALHSRGADYALHKKRRRSDDWKEGDLIPDYVVSRADAKDSAADNNAIAGWKNGQWTVVVIRPLNLANNDDKALKEGGVYNVGFAVHDDSMTTRGHHVSFVRTLGIGAQADIKAVKLK